jgi:hypothetical protein
VYVFDFFFFHSVPLKDYFNSFLSLHVFHQWLNSYFFLCFICMMGFLPLTGSNNESSW